MAIPNSKTNIIDYYDVTFSKQLKDNKKSYRTIGRAFPMKNGGIKVEVDCLPIGEWDGTFLLFAKDKEGHSIKE